MQTPRPAAGRSWRWGGTVAEATVIHLQAGPQVERRGLGYVVRFPLLSVSLGIDRLRERGGELSGELTVSVTDEVSGADRHLIRCRFNLSSLTARKSMVGSLQRLEHAEGIPWDLVIEGFCMAVLNAQRAGQPWEEVGGPEDGNPDESEAMILSPVLWAGAPTLLFAPGGSGKSTLAGAIAVSVTTGRIVVPGWRPMSAPVLLLDWEDAGREWSRQIRAISRGAGIEAPKLTYRRMSGSLADQIEEIAAYVSQHATGLVVVDSVEAACGAGRESEGFNDRVQRLFDALRVLDVAVLLLDHVAGSDLDREGASPKPFGGIFKLNRARAVFELHAEKEPTPERIEVSITDTKRNRRAKLPTQSLAINFSDFDEQGRARCIRYEAVELSAPELVRRLSNIDRIDHLLRSGPQGTKAIASELDLTEAAVRTYVSRSPRFARLADGSVGLAR